MSEEHDDIMKSLRDLGAEVKASKDIFTMTAARLETSVEGLHKVTMETARELGGIQSTFKALHSNGKRMDVRLGNLESRQADCPARQGIIGVNSRIKRLEKFKEKIQEERGEVSVVTALPVADTYNTPPSMAAAIATASIKDIIVKFLPISVGILAVGIAVGGAIIAWLLFK